MIDLVFAVENPQEWHSHNMVLNPSHYTPIINLSSSAIASIQHNFGARIWYNTLIESKLSRSPKRMMKYGVISKADLVVDLVNWETLYLAGRLHKPVQIMKRNDEVLRAIDINKEHAVRTGLLLLQPRFTEKDLFLTIASLSYIGGPRMIVGENPRKIHNLVRSSNMLQCFISILICALFCLLGDPNHALLQAHVRIHLPGRLSPDQRQAARLLRLLQPGGRPGDEGETLLTATSALEAKPIHVSLTLRYASYPTLFSFRLSSIALSSRKSKDFLARTPNRASIRAALAGIVSR